jgi:hypothetical protein
MDLGRDTKPAATKGDTSWIRYEWRTKLLTTRNGHGQSGWSPTASEGLYFHAMYKNRVSVSGLPISVLNVLAQIPLPTTLVFRQFCYIYIYLSFIQGLLCLVLESTSTYTYRNPPE